LNQFVKPVSGGRSRFFVVKLHFEKALKIIDFLQNMCYNKSANNLHKKGMEE